MVTQVTVPVIPRRYRSREYAMVVGDHGWRGDANRRDLRTRLPALTLSIPVVGNRVCGMSRRRVGALREGRASSGSGPTKLI